MRGVPGTPQSPPKYKKMSTEALIKLATKAYEKSERTANVCEQHRQGLIVIDASRVLRDRGYFFKRRVTVDFFHQDHPRTKVTN
jgi:hypothetical protein